MKIPSRIPGRLSIRGGSSAIFSSGPASYTYAFNGIPFLSAASELDYGRRKIVRRTAPFRKDQVDQQVNPGEQSLDDFWRRSQLSFHAGAGQLYNDADQDVPLSDIRFWKSKNIDVWTQGRIKLLSRVVAASATTVASINDLEPFTTSNGVSAVGFVSNTQVGYHHSSGTVFVETWTADGSQPKSWVTNGSHMFVATTSGVWRAPIPASGSGFTWTQLYAAVTVGPIVGWVKERLFFGADTNLYELNPFPGGALPAALPTAAYTSTATNWRWASIAESKSAIYACGSGAGGRSAILKFTLDTAANPPTLSGGEAAATLPAQERATALFGYLGDFLGIGTNRGMRVARSDDSGDLVYGPLLWEQPVAVTDITGRDRFLFATYRDDAEPGIKVARIDLSTEIESLRFAYAADLSFDADTGASTRLAFDPAGVAAGPVLLLATASNLYREDPTLRATSGYLDTSRIRFSTLEPKVFRSVRLRGPALQGSLGVSIINENDSVSPLYTYSPPATPGFEDIDLLPPSKRNYVAFRFSLNASVAGTAGAEMEGWQVKALPGAPRQRLFVLPLWCFDFEKDRFGQRVGGHRFAVQRLRELEALDEAGDVVTFQDLDAETSRQVFIEEVEFEQSDPPPGFERWGGIIRITFRSI